MYIIEPLFPSFLYQITAFKSYMYYRDNVFVLIMQRDLMDAMMLYCLVLILVYVYIHVHVVASKSLRSEVLFAENHLNWYFDN